MTRTADAFPSKYRQRVWEAHWHGHETPCWLCQVCDRDMEWEWARGGSRWRWAGADKGTQTPDHTDPSIPDPFRDAVLWLPSASILQWFRGAATFVGARCAFCLLTHSFSSSFTSTASSRPAGLDRPCQGLSCQ
jgi:hypothetical protein